MQTTRGSTKQISCPTPAVAAEPLFRSDASQVSTPTTSTTTVNQPLDFELKGLRTTHPFFTSKGLSHATIRHFGLGFASRGLMAGRIVIPLHDSSGRLVGYCGRVVDDSTISQDTPKYKFPARREHHGVVHQFDKSRFLYNAHRIKRPVDHLVVVQWFPAVWWLAQVGIYSAVALMDSFCSKEQAELLLRKTSDGARISVWPDVSEDATRCAHSIFSAVGLSRWTQWIRHPQGRSITECKPDDLNRYLRA